MISFRPTNPADPGAPRDLPLTRRSFLRAASLLMASSVVAEAQTTIVAAPQVPTLEGTEFDAKIMRSLADFTELSFNTAGPTPYGACVLNTVTGEELMRAVNKVRLENDPSAHGEVNAIRLACKKLGSPSLKGYTLYTTCEPCGMCTICCLNAGLDRVVYGVAIPDVRLPGGHRVQLRCAEILSRTETPFSLTGHVERDRCVAIFTNLEAKAAAAKPA